MRHSGLIAARLTQKVVRRTGCRHGMRRYRLAMTGCRLRQRRSVLRGHTQHRHLRCNRCGICNRQRTQLRRCTCRCQIDRRLRLAARQRREERVGQLRQRGRVRQTRRQRQATHAGRITCRCRGSHGTCRSPRLRAPPARLQSARPASNTAKSGRTRWRSG